MWAMSRKPFPGHRWLPVFVGMVVFALLWLSYIPACEGQNTCGGKYWAPTLIWFGIWYRELNIIEAWRGDFRWDSTQWGAFDYRVGFEYTRTESCTSACSADVYDSRGHRDLRRYTWDTNLPDADYTHEEYNDGDQYCRERRCRPDDRCDEEAEIASRNPRAIVPGQRYFTWLEFLVKRRDAPLGMRYEVEVERYWWPPQEECQLTCVHHRTPR